MGAYAYQAIDQRGKTRKGVIEAASAVTARRALRDQQMMPVRLEPASVKADRDRKHGALGPWLDRLAPAISGKALALMTRQLATLTQAGTRIDTALETVARQSRRPVAASLALTLRAGIAQGRPLSQALAEHPSVFSPFYCASVAAAEETNRLGPVLRHLAEHIESQQRNRQSIQLALIYPALLAVVSLIVIFMLLTFVVPDIARAFTARGDTLPLLTRAMIWLGDGVAQYGWAVPLGLAALGFAAARWLGRKDNRRHWHRWLATARLTRGPVRQMNAARFARILATTLQSGVVLPRALAAASEATANLYLRDRVTGVIERIEQGASLHRAMTEAACFPPMLLAMVASGEASADLGPSIARAAEDQQRELDAWVATLVALVEPGVLLVMGGFVMLMVLSILLPIIGLNDLAGSGL